MSASPWFIGCDENLTLTGMRDAVSGTYLNTATVTYAITDSNGTAVPGGTGSLDYVAASNGNYLGIVDGAITGLMVNGRFYTATLTFVQGNYNDVRKLSYMAVDRGAS